MTSQTPGGRSNHLSYGDLMDSHILGSLLLFWLPQQRRQTMLLQFCVNTQNLWSCLIKYNGRKKQNSRQPETGIIYERKIIKIFQKAQRIHSVNRSKLQLSLYNHLEVHSRRYMTLRNRRAYSFSNIITAALGDRHCRCLTKNRLQSPLGVWTNREQETS